MTHKAAFQGQSFATTGTLPASLLVAGADGARCARGRRQRRGRRRRGRERQGRVDRRRARLVFSTTPRAFRQHHVFRRCPADASGGTVAINAKLATDKHLHVGEPIGLATEQGVQQVTDLRACSTSATRRRSAARRWWRRRWPTPSAGTHLEGQYSGIAVAAQPGVTPRHARAGLTRALPAYADVKTSAQSAGRRHQGRQRRHRQRAAGHPAGLRRRGRDRGRLHHLQRLLDHRGPAHPRVRHAALAGRHAPPGAGRACIGEAALARPGRLAVGHRRRRGHRQGHQRAVQSGRRRHAHVGDRMAPRTVIVSLVIGIGVAAGRRAGAGAARHARAAGGGPARGRDAAAVRRQPLQRRTSRV